VLECLEGRERRRFRVFLRHGGRKVLCGMEDAKPRGEHPEGYERQAIVNGAGANAARLVSMRSYGGRKVEVSSHGCGSGSRGVDSGTGSRLVFVTGSLICCDTG
jgi:hypothetical protein